ncbi:MAG TPA: c-type cytochrome domain-containing protein [Opitutaceae bacterium]|nr:c-type cytochrome domain-containing protein [Opitutaceae bacterium]
MQPDHPHRPAVVPTTRSLRKFFAGLAGGISLFGALAARADGNPPVFTGVVEPILARSCVSCHGEKKQKKNLRLDSLTAIMKGAKDGAVVVPGNADQSELTQRLHLDPDDDDHMPPKNKPQLTGREILILDWWINAGAPGDVPLTSLKVPGDVAAAIRGR